MHIELKDHGGKTYRVPAEGAVLGRDPKRSDVVLADMGVSGAHARVYRRDGVWYLEDLRSSNGTYVGEQRATGPIRLEVGMLFSLFRWRFEVTAIDAADGFVDAGEPDASKTAPFAPLASGRATQRSTVSQAAAAVLRSSGEVPVATGLSRPASATRPDVASAGASTVRPAPVRSVPTRGSAGDAGGRSPLSGFTMERLTAGVGEALRYYAAALPALVLRPVAETREGLSERSGRSLEAADIAAWTFASILIGGLAGALARVVVALATGAPSVSALVLSPLVAVAVAAAAGVLNGLLWHPVLEWLVRKLGGLSDAPSRSAMLVAVCTALPLLSIAAALGTLIALVPLPFVGVAGALLGIAANVLLFFVLFAWYRSFDVAPWFTVAVLALGAIALVGPLYDATRAVRAGLAVGAGSAPVVPGAAPVAVLPAGAAADAGGSVGPTAAAVETSPPSGAPAGEAPAAVTPLGSSAAQAPPVIRGPIVIPAPEAATAAAPGSAAPSVVATNESARVGSPTPGEAAPSQPALTYAEYLARRAAVEKAIELDPPLLTRVPRLVELYRRLDDESARVKAKYAARARKGAGPDVLTERLRDAEIYDATVDLVAEMDRLIRAAR